MMSKEYAPKQISIISLKYGIFLLCNHWILSTSSSYENFPFFKKNISFYISFYILFYSTFHIISFYIIYYFILYFTSDSYAAMTLKYK